MIHLAQYQISLFLRAARPGVMMSGSVAGNGGTRLDSNTGFTLRSLLKQSLPEQKWQGEDCGVHSLVWDSRQVSPGSLFFAMKGDQFDGNDFIPDAVQRGAIAVVTDAGIRLPAHVRVVRVPDVRLALAGMAKTFYGAPDRKLQCVGVTGTNGKTTVSRVVKYLLDQGRGACGLIGTVDYVIGDRVLPAHKTTPEIDEVYALMSEMVSTGCDSLSMEVSSHGIAQKRVHGIGFDTLVFLNLTQDHLDYHGSMESYFETKAGLFLGTGNPLPSNAVINLDDEYGKCLSKVMPESVRLLTFSCGGKADFSASNIRTGTRQTTFELASPEGVFQVESPLIGAFNVSNILAALTAGYAHGHGVASMVSMLSGLPAVPGRMEEIDEGQSFVVLVDYAHTPDALDKTLSTVRGVVSGDVHVVFGCGGDRDREKRPLMMAAACKWARTVIATSDNPRLEEQQNIFCDMLEGVSGETAVMVEEDRQEAINRAIRLAGENDAVVIAGKGHEAFQILKHTMIPFDDRLAAREALRNLSISTSAQKGVY